MEIENYIFETKNEDLVKNHSANRLKAMYKELTGLEFERKSAKKEEIARSLKRLARSGNRAEAFRKLI
jgi:hypothetical protein